MIFYLWSSVCREEYGTPRSFFRTAGSGEQEFSFNDLYDENGQTLLHGFMEYLGSAWRDVETPQGEEEA